jgi:hypothetical protein
MTKGRGKDEEWGMWGLPEPMCVLQDTTRNNPWRHPLYIWFVFYSTAVIVTLTTKNPDSFFNWVATNKYEHNTNYQKLRNIIYNSLWMGPQSWEAIIKTEQSVRIICNTTREPQAEFHQTYYFKKLWKLAPTFTIFI